MNWTLLLIFVGMGVIMYFFMIRPARKQQRKQQEIMDSLDIGSRVMLGSGIYATIRHLGEKQAVIEVSPGVDMTILRAAIRTVVSPDEEEFEYSDELTPEVSIGGLDMDALEADVASAFAPPPDPEESPAEAEDLDTDTDNEK